LRSVGHSRAAQQFTHTLVPTGADLHTFQRRERVSGTATDIKREGAERCAGVVYQQTLINDEPHRDVVQRCACRGVVFVQQPAKGMGLAIQQSPLHLEQTVRAFERIGYRADDDESLCALRCPP
jgi:hypothetical protein